MIPEPALQHPSRLSLSSYALQLGNFVVQLAMTMFPALLLLILYYGRASGAVRVAHVCACIDLLLACLLISAPCWLVGWRMLMSSHLCITLAGWQHTAQTPSQDNDVGHPRRDQRKLTMLVMS